MMTAVYYDTVLRMIVANVFGGLAQLVEHLLCKQGVNGSNPLFSTFRKRSLTWWERKTR